MASAAGNHFTGEGEKSASDDTTEVRHKITDEHDLAISRLIAESGEFDESFYLETYADIKSSGMDAALHYVKYGSAEGRHPNKTFVAADYLLLNADVAQANIDPFLHYVEVGKAQRRPVSLRGRDYNIHERRLVGRSFEYDLYDARYPEARQLGLDALTHFLEVGWRDGADPNAQFSTRDYEEANLDVKQAGINPIVHYLNAGRREGRTTSIPLNWQRRAIANAISTGKRAGLSYDNPPPRVAMQQDRMSRLVAALIPQHQRSVVISISHDEYTLNIGGVQSCIRREQSLANEQGIAYVHLAPTNPTLTFRDIRLPGEMTTVTIDGERLGHVDSVELASIFSSQFASRKETKVSLVVHSFLGHARETIDDLHERLNVQCSIVWIHDCSTLCSNYALLRNDVEFCWSPPVRSWSCRACVYGKEREHHLASVNRLFDALQPTIIFPSTAIKDLWLSRHYHAYRKAIVLPHASIIADGQRRRAENGKKIRVAFAGAPVSHKGWNEFKQLANRFWGDERYEFFHFGTIAANERMVRFVPVTVHDIEKNEMVEELQKYDIDVVVQWTLCFETFSFSTLEAVAAGCYVLARANSGNAAVITETTGSGEIVACFDDLVEMFLSRKIEIIVEDRRRRAVDLGHLQAPCAVDNLLDGENVGG